MIRLHPCLLIVLALFVIPGTRAGTLLVANKSEATVSLFDLPAAQLRATVSVFDSRALDKLADIRLPGFPIRAEADDPRGRVYVTLPQADALAVIDHESREERSRLQFDVPPDRSRKTLLGDMLPDSSIPIGVLLSGDGQSLFVAHSNSHVITAYDAQSLERRATIPTGLEPDGMGWSPLDVAP